MARGLEQNRRRGRGSGRGAGGRWGAAPRGKPRAGGAKEADKKGRVVSIKNRIRSIERLLRKEDLAEGVKAAQEKKLGELRALAEEHAQQELERAMALRYRKIKFFERRKIERRMRRVERQQRALADAPGEDPGGQLAAQLARQMAQLREDLEYVRFFPKTERYVSLFLGSEDAAVVGRRKELRARIKANLAAAAAAGHDLEETGSEDDGMQDMSADEFFMGGSSSDDADADDELGDDTSREQVPRSPVGPAISSPAPAPAPARRQHSHPSAAKPPPRPPARPPRAPVPNGPTRHPAGLAASAGPSQKGQAARALMPPPRPRTQRAAAGQRARPAGPSEAVGAAAGGSDQKPKRKRKHSKKKGKG